MAEFADRVKKLLESLAGTGELVEIETKDEGEDFDVVSILSVSDDTYTVRSTNSSGRPDGFYVEEIDRITRVSRGTQYLAAKQLLSEKFYSAPFPPNSRNMPKIEGWFDMLNFAKQEQIMVSVVYYDETIFYGYVTEVSEEHFILAEVDRLGHLDGTTMLSMENVDRIAIDLPVLEARTFLHKVRMGL